MITAFRIGVWSTIPRMASNENCPGRSNQSPLMLICRSSIQTDCMPRFWPDCTAFDGNWITLERCSAFAMAWSSRSRLMKSMMG